MGEPSVVRISLLGGFRVAIGGQDLPTAAWRRRKPAALIKLLALAPTHRLHREEVEELLWPELPPEAAANNLHQVLHAARGILEPARPPTAVSAYLHLERDLLALRPVGPLIVDVEQFRDLATQARRTREPAAFEAALRLYSGDLLPEDRFEDWAAGYREELRATFAQLLLDLAALHEARGAATAAIEALRRLVSHDQTHEEARTGLMRLYAQLGDRQQALHQYDALRVALRRDLDADPHPATRRLHQAIHAGRYPDARAGSSPAPAASRPQGEHDGDGRSDVGDPDVRSAKLPPTNLTAHLTSFIGRGREMAEVRRLLTVTRLLTLTGAGGCGKTRLGLEVAAGLLAEYPDGVWLVELAALADPSLVPQAVAATLGVRDPAGQPLLSALSDRLRPCALLLVLDNCEHLIDACAALVDALLRACPRLSVLATSREALGVTGEAVWCVPSLAIPECGREPSTGELDESDAVRLFVARAWLAQPGFALTSENAAAVARVCQRLDGIPLALELAAVRVRALGVEHVADRLDDCLGLLVHGGRTLPPRHQTLGAVMDWSHDLLDEPERAVFRRLSVFAGGFTLEAAEHVGGRRGASPSVLDVLARLVDKSLVVTEMSGGQVRHRLLEPVRQYAARRLLASGETDRVREWHAGWFLALAEAAEPNLQGEEQRTWLDRLETEHDNLRAALAWSVESGHPLRGLRLAGALGRFWQVRGYLSEGGRWLDRVLAASDGAPAHLRAKAFFAAGLLTHWRSDLPRAVELYGASLTLWREVGETKQIAYCLNQLGILAEEVGDYPRATALLEESLALRRAIGDRWGVASTLLILGNAANSQADYERANALYEETLSLLREIGDQRGAAITVVNLAIVANRQGRYRAAEALAEQGLDQMRAAGERVMTSEALWNLGLARWALGDEARALAHYEEALEIHRAAGDRWGSTTTLLLLGKAARGRGDDRRAAAFFAESLTLRQQLGDRRGIAASFEAIAALVAHRGRFDQAAQLFGAADGLRGVLSTPMPVCDRALYERAVDSVRSALASGALAATWETGRSLPLDEAVAMALAAAEAITAAPEDRPPGDAAAVLSRREREVAALIAQGLTNREIAVVLGMSARTADTHVGRILRKLGLTSRHQVPDLFDA